MFYQLYDVSPDEISLMMMGERDGKFFALLNTGDGKMLYGREGLLYTLLLYN